ncbi:MAG: HEAT repeat domain-containing protein, partial [Planctomycetales bacterium]
RLIGLGPALVLAAIVIGIVLYWTKSRDQTDDRGGPPPESDSIGILRSVESLVALGSEAVPKLVAMSSSPNPAARRYALFGLGQLGPTALYVLPSISDRLTDKDSEVRGGALTAFSQICDDPDEVAAVAARMMTDSDFNVRRSAAAIAQESGPRAIPKLIELRTAELAETRAEVIRLLKPFRIAKVTEALRGFLEDTDERVRSDAIEAVGLRDAARPEELRKWLSESNPKVVDATLGAIGRLGPPAAEALPELETLLKSSESRRLSDVLSALQALKGEARSAIPAVLRRVAELEGYLRTKGCECLLEIGADPAQVVPLLTPLLAKLYAPDERLTNDGHAWSRFAGKLLSQASPDEARRQASRLIRKMEQDERAVTKPAIDALSGMRSEAREAVPLLTRLIQRERAPRDLWIRLDCVEALGSIGPDAASAVPALMALLAQEDLDGDLYERVLMALGQIGPPARSAVPNLLEFIEHPSDRMQGMTSWWPALSSEAVKALGQIGDNSPEVLAKLRRQLTTDEGPIGAHRRRRALDSLIQLDGSSAETLANLLSSLDDESVEVRLLAALALARWNRDEQELVARLVTALGDESPYVQTAAALALWAIGPAAKSAVPELRKIARDGNHTVANIDRLQQRLYLDQELMLFVPREVNLHQIGVADAAQMALDRIEPGGETATKE